MPSIFKCPGTVKHNVKQKRLVTESNIKSVRKCYDYLSEHNYVLKLPDTHSMSEDIGSEITVDPATCMVQTLKVGSNFISDPYVINLSRSREPNLEIYESNSYTHNKCNNFLQLLFFIYIIDICLYLFIDPTIDFITESDKNQSKLEKILEKNWREIATTQTATIKNLKKKIKVLQQKIRRQNSKIGTLKVSISLHII